MNKAGAFLITISIFISTHSNAQVKKINAGGIEIQVSAADTSLNAVFCSVGEMPEFPGGTTKLIAFAKSKIKYPKTAVNDNVQGSVFLQFIIDKKGMVIERKIFKGVRYDLDSICLSMLSQMPKWKPGRLNGRPLDVHERWEIRFVLIN